jgi:hypothetical protein
MRVMAPPGSLTVNSVSNGPYVYSVSPSFASVMVTGHPSASISVKVTF